MGLRVPLKWSKHSGPMPRGTAGLGAEHALRCRSQHLLFLSLPVLPASVAQGRDSMDAPGALNLLLTTVLYSDVPTQL